MKFMSHEKQEVIGLLRIVYVMNKHDLDDQLKLKLF